MPADATGKHVIAPIQNGQGILPDILSDAIPAGAVPGGAVLPVEVKTDHIAGPRSGDLPGYGTNSIAEMEEILREI
jgi:hypothetical protein